MHSRIPVLTKLKYVGIQIEDLLTVYKLFIRCIPEYCSVVFNKSITNEQCVRIENIQKTCLKIILDDMYVDYNSALEMCSLEKLSERRNKRMLKFSLKCTNNSFNKDVFPLNGKSFKKKSIK